MKESSDCSYTINHDENLVTFKEIPLEIEWIKKLLN